MIGMLVGDDTTHTLVHAAITNHRLPLHPTTLAFRDFRLESLYSSYFNKTMLKFDQLSNLVLASTALSIVLKDIASVCFLHNTRGKTMTLGMQGGHNSYCCPTPNAGAGTAALSARMFICFMLSRVVLQFIGRAHFSKHRTSIIMIMRLLQPFIPSTVRIPTVEGYPCMYGMLFWFLGSHPGVDTNSAKHDSTCPWQPAHCATYRHAAIPPAPTDCGCQRNRHAGYTGGRPQHRPRHLLGPC